MTAERPRHVNSIAILYDVVYATERPTVYDVHNNNVFVYVLFLQIRTLT